jgi:hypothetical protein
MPNLIQQLQNDILDQNSSLSTVLRKAKVLAVALGSEELEGWVDQELNGYSDASHGIPDYRRISVQNYGDFFGSFGRGLRNAPIPLGALPKDIRELSKDLILNQGVGSIQSLLETNSSGSLKLAWPPDLVALLQRHQVYENLDCGSAWKMVSRGSLVQVLETVRNRLLTFVLELKKRNPEIVKSEEVISEVPKDQVSQIFHTHIYGDQNVIATGLHVTQLVHQEVSPQDIESLLRYVEKVGVLGQEAQELRTAIQEDGARPAPKKFGPKVAEWIGNMTKKALEGTWDVATEVATTTITKALSRYYGWE